MAQRAHDREASKFEDIPSSADPAFPETQVPVPLKAAVRTIDAGYVIVTDATGADVVVPSPTGEVDTLVDEHSTVVDQFFIGKASIGASTASAVWQIKRITVTEVGGILSVDIGWADSNRAYDNIYANREALSYSK